jgi:lysophospholipase L1-like esterase
MKATRSVSLAAGLVIGVVAGILFQREGVVRKMAAMMGEARVPALSPHQRSRIETLRSLPVPDGAVVFLGDSLLDSQEWHEVFGNAKVLSRTVSGATSRDLSGLADFSNAAAVFCLVGTNDAGYNVSTTEFTANYRKLLDEMPEEAKVFLISIPPIRMHGGHSVDVRTLTRLNDAIRQLADSKGFDFLDLYAAFGGADGFFADDGLHLSPAGYECFLKIAGPAARAALSHHK